MKRERDEIFPQPRLILQFRQPRFRRRTTAAALRGEELNQMRFLSTAFENPIARSSRRNES
jgi:hypothetical protein